MKSSLQERFARLGPIRAIERVTSGSAAVLSLARKTSDGDVLSITATLSLAKRGLSMLRAKRAIEAMLDDGRVWLELPTVESMPKLRGELEAAGIAVAVVDEAGTVDVAAIRNRLGLTQEQFALRFGFDLRTLQNWEAATRQPDRATRSYLRVIARIPRQVEAALFRAA